ncbi:sigma-54 dependent transcriptional regulator [Maricurvus nonylphenolicus]|uniref:sigma-54 dependent transcriptional regulator n=1 Tax=Maricurvus nonylphenolicus TaxID=1008307 RepID=UPI0036F21FA8
MSEIPRKLAIYDANHHDKTPELPVCNQWQLIQCDHHNALTEHHDCGVGIAYLAGASKDEIQASDEFFYANDWLHWIAIIDRQQINWNVVIHFITQHCYDYHTLPFYSSQQLEAAIGHAHGMHLLQQCDQYEHNNSFNEMVATSNIMLQLFQTIRRVSPVDAPVLITGPSGTGKELVAKAIHQRSQHHKGPFIAVNCGAIPENLLESELFGHTKGAFTGASRHKIGRIEAAAGGTLLLDEISELPQEHQVKILRFLQEGTIDPIGAVESHKVNTRVIAATNKSLQEEVDKGLFRADLFYRLNVLSLDVPALNQRGEDIELLAKYYLEKFRADSQGDIRGFSRDALQALRQYEWPGNVRELINRVRRALVMCNGRWIGPEDLGIGLSLNTMDLLPLEKVREQAEQQALTNTLQKTGHNVSETARKLGVSRMTCYRLIDKYNLMQ